MDASASRPAGTSSDASSEQRGLLARIGAAFSAAAGAVAGIALAIFVIMFTVSTLWIGPAIRGDGSGDNNGQPTDHSSHHS